MNNNEEQVIEEITENVEEQATEELVEGASEQVVDEPKLYSEKEKDAEVDKLLSKKIGRKSAKIRENIENEYADDLEIAYIAMQGLGIEDKHEAIQKMREFYAKGGKDIPEFKKTKSNRDEEKLAKLDAEEIIDDGLDSINDELERLTNKSKLSVREQKTLEILKNEKNKQDSIIELKSIGVDSKELENADFVEFSKMLDKSLSTKEKYELYLKYNPKPVPKAVPSLKEVKNNSSDEVKDFYTREEAVKFTRKDFDKNPKLFEAIQTSMTKW